MFIGKPKMNPQTIWGFYFTKKRTLSCFQGSFYSCLVPKAGLEPARSCLPGILSPLCLPFHHFGKHVATWVSLGGTTQIRTGDEGFADLCLTTWLWCHVSSDGGNSRTRTYDPLLVRQVL